LRARQFRLTRAGALFLDPAKALLDDVGAAKAALSLADQAPPLALRIASLEELDATVTAPWLVKLSDRFPKAALSLTSGASHENHDALSSRAVDMTLAVDTVARVDWVERHAGPAPARGFAFSTNQALFAMTAELGGWAITTALAYLGTPLARDLVTARPLHIPRFSRQLELHARAGALGDLPRIIADDLRSCIASRILPQANARLTFLDAEMDMIQFS